MRESHDHDEQRLPPDRALRVMALESDPAYKGRLLADATAAIRCFTWSA